MPQAPLYRLIYSSSAVFHFNPADIPALLQIARPKNKQLGVSGLLLYSAGTFLQVLEGPEETVEALFSHILKDRRHKSIRRITQEKIGARICGQWAMGYAEVQPGEIDAVEGLWGQVKEEDGLHLEEAPARRLLQAFCVGRLRSRVSDESAPSLLQAPTRDFPRIHPGSFSFAFQPLVDMKTQTVYSYEALVRGLNNEPAHTVINRYAASQMAEFDAACRARAIEVAHKAGLSTRLNINFLPSATPSAGFDLNSTIEAATHHGFALDRIIVETTEHAALANDEHFSEVIGQYRQAGMKLALDDFGAGQSGLNLLSKFQPDLVKLDMGLVRGIEHSPSKQSIVRAIWQVCMDLGIEFVVEGVETLEEFNWFQAMGAHLYQGYLFAKPLFEALPDIHLPQGASERPTPLASLEVGRRLQPSWTPALQSAPMARLSL